MNAQHAFKRITQMRREQAKLDRKQRTFKPIPRRPGRCIACGGEVSSDVECCGNCESPLVMQRTGLDVDRRHHSTFGEFGRDSGWLEDIDAYRRAPGGD